MGCGCKHGNGSDAFDRGHLEVGESEVASPIAAMFELGELEEERRGHRRFAGQTSLARPRMRRRTPAAPMAHLKGHGPQTRPRAISHAAKQQSKGQKSQARSRQQSRFGGRRGGLGPWGYAAPIGGMALAPNAVILNRRYADQLGWRAYFDQIVALLGPVAAGGESAFVQAVSQWQATKGLPASGVLDAANWAQMQGDLAAGPAAQPLAPAAPLAPPAAALPLAAEPPPLADAAPLGGEMEWESESGSIHARPASRRWAHCPPTAEMPPTERTVLAVTSRLQTGKPFACTVSAHDGISMGLIRWNLRNGTLQRLLARFENRSGRLIRFFGADYDRLMGLIALRHSAPQRGRAVAVAFADRLADRWRGPLLSLFSDTTFYSMLMQDVRGRLAAAKGAARRLGLWTVRGLALLFDIAACEGLGRAKIARLAARLRRLEATRGPLSEQEKLVAIADESVRRLARHRDERRALRMVIATGSGPARGRWWDLGRDYANLDAPWES